MKDLKALRVPKGLISLLILGLLGGVAYAAHI